MWFPWCFAAARDAFDREDESNLVWPQMAASDVSLAKGESLTPIILFDFVSLVKGLGRTCIFAVAVDHEMVNELTILFTYQFTAMMLPWEYLPVVWANCFCRFDN